MSIFQGDFIARRGVGGGGRGKSAKNYIHPSREFMERIQNLTPRYRSSGGRLEYVSNLHDANTKEYEKVLTFILKHVHFKECFQSLTNGLHRETRREERK